MVDPPSDLPTVLDTTFATLERLPAGMRKHMAVGIAVMNGFISYWVSRNRTR